MLLHIIIFICLVGLFWTFTNMNDSAQKTSECIYGAAEDMDTSSTLNNNQREFETFIQELQDSSEQNAKPAPPSFEVLDTDLLPQRYWEPTFVGVQSASTKTSCKLSSETPRLLRTDLQEHIHERARQNGKTNLIEPLKARQTHAQFLTLGQRSKRDAYTRAAANNDASQSLCARIKANPPLYLDSNF